MKGAEDLCIFPTGDLSYLEDLLEDPTVGLSGVDYLDHGMSQACTIAITSLSWPPAPISCPPGRRHRLESRTSPLARLTTNPRRLGLRILDYPRKSGPRVVCVGAATGRHRRVEANGGEFGVARCPRQSDGGVYDPGVCSYTVCLFSTHPDLPQVVILDLLQQSFAVAILSPMQRPRRVRRLRCIMCLRFTYAFHVFRQLGSVFARVEASYLHKSLANDLCI